MLVYRIESSEGEGIYSAGFGHRFTRAAMQGNQTDLIHPSPEEEPELRVFWLGLKLSRKKQISWEMVDRRAWYCGFESMERLLDWWSPEGLELMSKTMAQHNKTARLVTYKLPANQVRKGGKQLVFKKQLAQIVNVQPLETFDAKVLDSNNF